MIDALHRMLSFYGFREENRRTIAKGSNWNERKDNWFAVPSRGPDAILQSRECVSSYQLSSAASAANSAAFCSRLRPLITADVETDSCVVGASATFCE